MAIGTWHIFDFVKKKKSCIFGLINRGHVSLINRGHDILFIIVYLKILSAIFYQIFIFSTNDGRYKTIKNVFHFI